MRLPRPASRETASLSSTGHSPGPRLPLARRTGTAVREEWADYPRRPRDGFADAGSAAMRAGLAARAMVAERGTMESMRTVRRSADARARCGPVSRDVASGVPAPSRATRRRKHRRPRLRCPRDRRTDARTHGHTRGRGAAPARRNSQIAPRRTWTAIAWPGARRTGAGVRPAACATVPGEADGVRHSTADRRPAARAAAPGAQGPTPGRRHVPRRYSQAANRAISGASAITSTWSWDRCANARHNATSASQSNVPWSTPVASSMTV